MYVFRTPFRSITNPISVQLIHKVFHIGKLGVDHEHPRIYIYFATAKSVLFISLGLKASQKDKLHQ